MNEIVMLASRNPDTLMQGAEAVKKEGGRIVLLGGNEGGDPAVIQTLSTLIPGFRMDNTKGAYVPGNIHTHAVSVQFLTNTTAGLQVLGDSFEPRTESFEQNVGQRGDLIFHRLIELMKNEYQLKRFLVTDIPDIDPQPIKIKSIRDDWMSRVAGFREKFAQLGVQFDLLDSEKLISKKVKEYLESQRARVAA